jgi:hypothetical protein
MTTTTDFKSPARKLIQFFQASRDGWKAKCLEAKYELKLLKRKHARLNRRCQELVQQCKQLEELKTRS